MPEKLIVGIDGQAIQHFGVKGMRWGVRKKRSSSSKSSRKSPGQISAEKDLARTKKIVAGFLISAGALKIANFAITTAMERQIYNHGVNAIANTIITTYRG